MTQLLQNAAYGTVLILIVAVLRRVLKDRLVPEARLALWAVCLFRLLTPAAPESALSLWGLSRLFETQKQPNPPVSNMAGAGYIPAAGAPAPATQPAAPVISWEAALAVLWLAVSLALAARYVLCWTRTRRAVGCAIPLDRTDQRYSPLPKCARLREGPMEGAPLTFGTVRPIVVLSPGLEGTELDCVLAHEGVHVRRRDNLWHYAMALALVVHWWNPAVWLMSRLLRRDIELSCDRAAIRRLGADRRAEYAQALVSLSTQGADPAFCHTFGRKEAEERILSIMKFKKISIIGAIFSLTLVLALTVAFASEPKQPQDDTVEFHGQTFSRSELSQGTLDWLDWYLDLSEEEQLAISYVPAELRSSWPLDVQDAYSSQKTASDISRVPYEAVAYVQDLTLDMSREDVHKALGEPSFSSSSLNSDCYELDDTHKSQISIYYNADGTVAQVTYFSDGMDPDDHGIDLARFLSDCAESAMYYRDENGNLVPFDSSGYVLNGGQVHAEINFSGSVLTLDEFLRGLAQRVKDGRLTQAEADQRIASLLDLMHLKSLDEITDRSVLHITVHEEDFTAGGYAAFGPFKADQPTYVEEGEDISGTLNAMGEFHGELDGVPYDYKVNPPTFDEDGNSVAADGGITGSKFYDYKFADSDGVVRTASGSYPICADANCTAAGTHCHMDGQVVPVSYQDPSTGSTTPPSTVPDPNTGYPVCTVSGCALTGHHTHNGVTYCGGSNHHSGTCGYNTSPSQSSASTHHSESHHSSGHHSSHH